MSHKLTHNDAWFLAMERIDPLAKEPFKVGDDVVVCARCKAVQLEDIWNMGQQCAVCGHKTQASTFSRSFIDFSYGRSKPSFLRWLQSPLLYRLRIILVYILPIIAVSFCVTLAFLSSNDPMEDLRATWDIALEFVLDGITTLESRFTPIGQIMVERFTTIGLQKWSDFIFKAESLNLEEIVTAIIGGITELPYILWNLITQLWHIITTGVMQFIQWIQAIFS